MNEWVAIHNELHYGKQQPPFPIFRLRIHKIPMTHVKMALGKNVLCIIAIMHMNKLCNTTLTPGIILHSQSQLYIYRNNKKACNKEAKQLLLCR